MKCVDALHIYNSRDYANLIPQHALSRLSARAGPAAVGGPVEDARALWVAFRDVGDAAPGGLEGVVNCFVEVPGAVAVLGGGDAGAAVAEEARGAESAETISVADGGVRVAVRAGDVCEARGVALRGGAARLVAAVVVVVALEPVQGAGPGDAGGDRLRLVVERG